MSDPLSATLQISGAGLRAQSERLRVVSENLANARSTGEAAGDEAGSPSDWMTRGVRAPKACRASTDDVEEAEDKRLRYALWRELTSRARPCWLVVDVAVAVRRGASPTLPNRDTEREDGVRDMDSERRELDAASLDT